MNKLTDGCVYLIYAIRKNSQFNQTKQIMRCKVLEAYSDYIIVESLKRYNKKYADSNRSKSERYIGRPIRRINKDQALVIIDEASGKWLNWNTIRRREGTYTSLKSVLGVE